MKYLLLILLFLIPLTLLGKKESKLHIGDIAPGFALPNQDNVIRTLHDQRGKRVVLYFYPKDSTRGCTTQACGLRDAFNEYKKNNIIIFGISYDSPHSHAIFKQKHHLPFDLLSDTKGFVARLYGTDRFWLWNFVPKRKTFLIDERGIIIDIMDDVNVKEHAHTILNIFNTSR